MSGNTVTHESTALAEQITAARDGSVAVGQAARELGLKRIELDIAVQQGRVRTVPDEAERGRRRVTRAEIERLRAEEGFPDALREEVRTVGTTEGAALMEITKARFTRLARLGLLVPVAFHLNRYRAVVWLYQAGELRQFAADGRNTALLRRRMPEGLREQLDAGLDLRPRNWRGRYLGHLLRRSDAPWERAAAVASLLDPVHVSDIVPDPYERSHLRVLRPAPPVQGPPGSPAAHIVESITTACEGDEADWLRADLAAETEAARQHSAAPRPLPEPRTPRRVGRGTVPPRVHRPQPRPVRAGHAGRPASRPGPSARPSRTVPRPVSRPSPDGTRRAPVRPSDRRPGALRVLLGRLRRGHP
ncbi:DUF6397 family protein [Streptomyces tagetis]|uniref:Uncharacterized protein n=1 Tax=Streptomyces tagetis TaxID=2820809 RepID=A0A940XHK9_9ACTN|nr:DUF6397 family protein [Streptomyces sp. RG38]MBQ0826701.1 hypothetical protein [Streptomyces sp. RG38]